MPDDMTKGAFLIFLAGDSRRLHDLPSGHFQKIIWQISVHLSIIVGSIFQEMNSVGRLVIDGNSVYEIDEECIRRKEHPERNPKNRQEGREQYPYRRPGRTGWGRGADGTVL